MAPGEAPELHTDGDLNGGRGKVLLLLAGLQLDQHLVELSEEKGVSAPPSQCRLPSGPPRMCPRVTPVSPATVIPDDLNVYRTAHAFYDASGLLSCLLSGCWRGGGQGPCHWEGGGLASSLPHTGGGARGPEGVGCRTGHLPLSLLKSP